MVWLFIIYSIVDVIVSLECSILTLLSLDAGDNAVNKPGLASTQTPIQVQNSLKGFTVSPVKEWTWFVVRIVHRAGEKI